MAEQTENQADHQLEFLEELEEEHVWIDGDVLQVDRHSWTIHGVIPYEGEVQMAVFNTYSEAKTALDRLLKLPNRPRSSDD